MEDLLGVLGQDRRCHPRPILTSFTMHLQPLIYDMSPPASSPKPHIGLDNIETKINNKHGELVCEELSPRICLNFVGAVARVHVKDSLPICAVWEYSKIA